MTNLLEVSSTVEITPLTTAIGAEVAGVSLAEVTDPSVIESLRTALDRHRVLFFRGQRLTSSEQVRVATWFGTPTPAHPLAGGIDEEHPEVLVLDSRDYRLGLGTTRGGSSYNDKWHTDLTFSSTPPAAAVLAADVIPSEGGDTLWADGVSAYRSLSEPLRRLIDPLRAWHTADGAFGLLADDDDAARITSSMEPVLHPVVRVHPRTGERAIFVNPAFTRNVEGLSGVESRALVDLLVEVATDPVRTVRWQWSEGDVAVWDNQVTSHFACADYTGHRRMRRVTVAGDRPFGPDEPNR